MASRRRRSRRLHRGQSPLSRRPRLEIAQRLELAAGLLVELHGAVGVRCRTRAAELVAQVDELSLEHSQALGLGGGDVATLARIAREIEQHVDRLAVARLPADDLPAALGQGQEVEAEI